MNLMDDYIADFSALLKQLDAEEQEEVVDFYREYLQDGHFTAYDDCIRELGTPRQLARKVLADYSIKNLEMDDTDQAGTKVRSTKPKDDVRTVWLIILAVLSTPITIPLAFGLACLSVAIFAAAFGVIIALLGLVVAVVVGGFSSLIIGIGILSSDIWLGLLYAGIGITIIGVLVMMVPLFSKVINGVIHGVTNFFRWAYQKAVPKNRAEKHRRGQ